MLEAIGRYALSLFGVSLVVGVLVSTGWGFPVTILPWTFEYVLPYLLKLTGPPFLLTLVVAGLLDHPYVGGRRRGFLAAMAAGLPWGVILYADMATNGGLPPDATASLTEALGYGVFASCFGAVVAGPAFRVRRSAPESRPVPAG